MTRSPPTRSSAKCVGLPDSGFFLDYESTKVPGLVEQASSRRGRLLTTTPGNYHAGLKWCFETFNASAGVNQDCIAAHGTGGFATDSPEYLCMFAEHTAVFTHTPIFALQSEYDSWQTGHVLAPGDAVQLLGNNLTKRIRRTYLARIRRAGASTPATTTAACGIRFASTASW